MSRSSKYSSEQIEQYRAQFAELDTDGSGELDTEEFFAAVRNDLAIGVDTITDTELESLFKQVDVDGGGEVDAEECARPTRRLANIG